jgi:peptidoglycan/LPS O-acetylase OafA/YrhL
MPKPNKKLEIISLLRVLGALGVAWFHFTNGNVSFLDAGWLKNSGKYGWLGVEVFFVISGFVVPYSLWYGKFQFQQHWGKFFVRRILRLHPAYIVSILVSIGLWYISSLVPGFKGQPYKIDVVNLMLHIGYLNGIFNQPWINPVFWTLGIEIQYYLLAMLVYPCIYSFNSAIKYPCLLLMYLLPFLFNQDNIIFHWLYIYIWNPIIWFIYKSVKQKTIFDSLISNNTPVKLSFGNSHDFNIRTYLNCHCVFVNSQNTGY